ncbi:hypothetical protein AMATHDRAFT_67601 [Amanita thiersii Skay4041]|uniref:Uncharacterized protein n=1 Tax=Amanita thiersii Skay4041 TaxID=703135 RepID=A0A2A9NA63_9AGAR|nr:hypothetical protein AMATHDRAFT_67601 [Amanita thiersii Skay4041]
MIDIIKGIKKRKSWNTAKTFNSPCPSPSPSPYPSSPSPIPPPTTPITPTSPCYYSPASYPTRPASPFPFYESKRSASISSNIPTPQLSFTSSSSSSSTTSFLSASSSCASISQSTPISPHFPASPTSRDPSKAHPYRHNHNSHHYDPYAELSVVDHTDSFSPRKSPIPSSYHHHPTSLAPSPFPPTAFSSPPPNHDYHPSDTLSTHPLHRMHSDSLTPIKSSASKKRRPPPIQLPLSPLRAPPLVATTGTTTANDYRSLSPAPASVSAKTKPSRSLAFGLSTVSYFKGLLGRGAGAGTTGTGTCTGAGMDRNGTPTPTPSVNTIRNEDTVRIPSPLHQYHHQHYPQQDQDGTRSLPVAGYPKPKFGLGLGAAPSVSRAGSPGAGTLKPPQKRKRAFRFGSIGIGDRGGGGGWKEEHRRSFTLDSKSFLDFGKGAAAGANVDQGVLNLKRGCSVDILRGESSRSGGWGGSRAEVEEEPPVTPVRETSEQVTTPTTSTTSSPSVRSTLTTSTSTTSISSIANDDNLTDFLDLRDPFAPCRTGSPVIVLCTPTPPGTPRKTKRASANASLGGGSSVSLAIPTGVGGHWRHQHQHHESVSSVSTTGSGSVAGPSLGGMTVRNAPGTPTRVKRATAPAVTTTTRRQRRPRSRSCDSSLLLPLIRSIHAPKPQPAPFGVDSGVKFDFNFDTYIESGSSSSSISSMSAPSDLLDPHDPFARNFTGSSVITSSSTPSLTPTPTATPPGSIRGLKGNGSESRRSSVNTIVGTGLIAGTEFSGGALSSGSKSSSARTSMCSDTSGGAPRHRDRSAVRKSAMKRPRSRSCDPSPYSPFAVGNECSSTMKPRRRVEFVDPQKEEEADDVILAQLLALM